MTPEEIRVTVEMELHRSDGKILRMIRDGQELEIRNDSPNDEMEIISESQATVTVPAGTFEAAHTVARSRQAERLELWVNPRDTSINGGIKQEITHLGIKVTVELASFVRN